MKGVLTPTEQPETTGIIRASYSPTFKDLVAGSSTQLKLRSFRRSGRIIGFMLLLMSAAVFSVPHEFSFMLVLLPIVAVLMSFGHYIIAVLGALLTRQLSEGKTYEFAFTRASYHLESPGAETTVSWGNVLEVVATKQGFLICPNKYLGIWVPSHSFVDAGGPNAFTSLMTEVGVKVKAG